jgi:tetratricopeptide (TPR) repeat protein
VNAQEEKAVERFKTLLDLDVKRSGYGHEILAYYYRDQSLVNEEMEEWEKALSIGANERYLVHIGVCYVKLGKYQEAMTTFEEAIQVYPNYALSYYNLGVTLEHIGKRDEAIKQYQAAINKDPHYLTAYLNLSALLAETGNYEETLEVLKSAIQINPNSFEIYYDLAITYYRMGKPEEVVPFFQAYLKQNPQDYQRAQELLKKMNIDLD